MSAKRMMAGLVRSKTGSRRRRPAALQFVIRRAGHLLFGGAPAPAPAASRLARSTSPSRLITGAFLAAMFLAGASSLYAAPSTNGVFTADLSQGQVDIALRAEPAQVRMGHDLLVTLRVSAPDGLNVTLPDLRDRFRGFKVADGFTREPVSANGITRFEQRWRLIPDLLRTYRLAPFSIEVRDRRMVANAPYTFATRPVVFPSEPPPDTVTGAPEVSPKPFWIPPTPRMIAGWIGFLLLVAGLAAALLWGLTLLSRHVHERRLSPRERAFAELDRLLHRHLIDKRLYKDFYIELTMVVRRYIERAHAIHAPEQTTQEFLEAAMHHPHFTLETLMRLKLFLESADLVKFAGQEATPAMADDSVASARDYVTTDAADEGRKPEVGNQKPHDANDKCSAASVQDAPAPKTDHQPLNPEP